MKRLAWSALILAAFVAAGIGGYRIGRHDLAETSVPAAAMQRAGGNSSPVIYYQDPDGKPFYSAEPKSTSDGRPWRAVHANEDISFDGEDKAEPKAAAAAPGKPKDSVLPQSDGPSRHLQDAEEGLDGDGLYRRLRRRGR